ncbi:MAG: M28 family peptidase [Bacteroidota bacterium]|nr:M28 family peptidase [Bacteroidota bacterium]
MIRRMSFVVLLLTVSIGVAQKSDKKNSEFGNVDYLTKAQLRDYLAFIASDELEGRDTPSRGLNIAAKYLATNLSRWGYKPAGDNGTFFQSILLQRSRVIPMQTFVGLNGQKYSFGSEFISTSIEGNVSAPLVYVGHGYILKEKNIDPYEGISVKGKIMVVLGGFPQGTSRGDFRGKIGIEYDSPANYAKTNGALGIITIPSARVLGEWEKTKNNVVEKGDLSVPAFIKPDAPPAVPSINASAKLIDALFSGEEIGVTSMSNRSSADSVLPFALSSEKKVTISVAVKTDTLFTQNVAAILEGSDKKLKEEYVAFSAHYDHLGITAPVNGDSINNGADDDGSGTVGLFAMAEAFPKGERTKRSLLFVWHCGEEKGLWGSKYFVAFPTVPLEKIVTLLNLDMIGRSKPDMGNEAHNDEMSGGHEIFSIGSMMMSSEIGILNEHVNNSFLKLRLNYKYDDPNDVNRFFYRSDHYNYAKMGIPIIFYFDGAHEDYHKVTDEIGKIDFDKYLKVVKTVYAVGTRIANLPKRPVVDKQFSREVID